jgi:hypothetical protein
MTHSLALAAHSSLAGRAFVDLVRPSVSARKDVLRLTGRPRKS